jgi:signal transduction histidine kinase/HAMP domain-containing protein
MRRLGLFLKYAIPLVILSSGAVIASGLVEMYFSYQESKAALARIQHEKAVAAAVRIEQYVHDLEHQIAWIAQAPWGPRGVTLDQRRLDSLRLLRQVPAITEVSHLDLGGHEQLRVSRLAMDVVGSNLDLSQDPKFKEPLARRIYFSPVYFRKESEPYMTIALTGSGENAGVVAAEANLKFIWDVVSGMKVGQGGHAYVVDANGRLIAHPDISLVLQNTDLSSLPLVRAATAQSSTEEAPVEAITGRDVQGREVLSASAQIAPLGWKVFVDLPLREAFAPLYSSLIRTGVLLLVGLAISILASLVLVRRMIAPIHVLQTGAARIGAGALDQRIEVRTGDELQTLGEEFNRMAERLQESYAGLELKVEERTRDLSEALEQQTATSEILRVISSSPTDLQPVLDAVAESAARLCDATDAVIFRVEGDGLRVVKQHGPIRRWLPEVILPLQRDFASGRCVLDRTVVHIDDVLAEPDTTSQGAKEIALRLGYRTVLVVPMVLEERAVGAIAIRRPDVRPFSEGQINLLKTFADQAVIAIENTRLFKELEERLEQQTATSEILRVISSSPTDVQPVLDTIAERAARLCSANDAVIFRVEGDSLRAVKQYGSLPPVPGDGLLPISREFVSGRAILDRQTIHIPDVLAEPQSNFAGGREIAVTMGYRTVVVAPMLREGEPIGVIGVWRAEASPFSDTQIALLQTFAAQAVIAIENVRLFQELQSRTQELGRSVEQLRSLAGVSQAVNSTLDLDQVLSTIVEQAVHLSSGDSGAVYEFNEAIGEFHPRATYGFPKDLVDMLLATPLRIGEGATGQAAARRAPVQIPDLRVEGAYSGPLQKLTMQAGALAVLAIPLMREERIVGSLVVSRNSVGEFPTEIVDLLQTFAAQSTLAIQNARLFREIEQKGRELEIASQHKSQFLANMSHELRTPLNAILGYTELIVDQIYGKVPEKIRDVLERVQKSGRHLLGLINDVLDLSKIEAGQLTLSLSDYSYQDAVQSAVTSVESLAKEKGLRLTVDVASKLPVGRGDERRIVQVLLNLVGNAIKFTDTGEVAVRVSAVDDAIRVSVSDTGPGIPEIQHERIFEEFQQADGSSTRAKGGTGLGLAIAKKIIELHGGRIWVESVVGKGSTFTFSLPVRNERQEGTA